MPLLFFGTPEQQQHFLPPFVSGEGEPLAALAFSEVGGSANFQHPDPEAGFRTVARRDGDEWVISGRKRYIPHASGWDGQGAELFAVACRTDMSLSSFSYSVTAPQSQGTIKREHVQELRTAVR